MQWIARLPEALHVLYAICETTPARQYVRKIGSMWLSLASLALLESDGIAECSRGRDSRRRWEMERCFEMVEEQHLNQYPTRVLTSRGQ